MKKHLKFFAFLGLLLLPSMMYAAYGSKFKLTNFRQVDETSFTFDLELHNTGDVAFGLDAAQCKIVYNQAIFGAQSGNIAQSRAVTPLSTDLIGSYGTNDGVSTTSLSTLMTVTGNPGYIVFVTNALPYLDNAEIDLFPVGAKKKLATIKVQFQTGTNPIFKKWPFEEVLHNLAFDANPINHTVNRVNAYNAVLTPGTVYKIGLIPDFTQMPQPTVENLPTSTANRLLAKYCFSGTGNYSSATLWNNTTSSDITGYHVAPSGTSNVIINSACTVSSSSTAANMTINPLGKLTLNDGITLSATKLFINSVSASETGTFVDKNATGGLTVSGTTEVQQYLTGAGGATPNNRFWYMSNPVYNGSSSIFDLANVNPASKLWSYSETGHAYLPITTTTALIVGTGYTVRLGANKTVTFSGEYLNTGNKSISVTRQNDANEKRGYNLVGNPYASYVNLALADNPNIETSIWYRTMLSSGSGMAYDTYNISNGNWVSGSGNGAISAFIPPMQAFWVKVKNPGNTTVEFKQANRSHQTGIALRKAEVSDAQTLRLQVSNGSFKDEALICFYPHAMDVFDNCDSHKLSNDNPSYPEIFTLAGNEEVAINGLAPLVGSKEVALGFRTGKEGTFVIKATELNELGDGSKVILVDKLLGLEQNLTEEDEYTFTSAIASGSSRFSLLFSKVATSLNPLNVKPTFTVVNGQNGSILVRLVNLDASSTTFNLYALSGQLLQSSAAIGAESNWQTNLNKGMYMLEVIGKNFTGRKKIIVNN